MKNTTKKSPETTTKTFLFKDKTGRGFTSRLSNKDIRHLEDEEDYYSNMLHEWAKEAEEGDEWENRVMRFICLGEGL